jgi:undecaprenyl phosphate N,N'-diacetylbacillosamine 1-phosphate transferase
MYLYFKSLFDFCFSFICILIFLPFFIVIVVLIKIFDPGPVFFLQERVGKNEKIFKIYKFRTMVVNADKIGPILTQTNDPRITKIGKFLRRTSLDELPQLINIIKGEMSLIGPRPEVLSIVKTYNPQMKKVFMVKPGLTGWAQINGRDLLTIEEKSVYDLKYIDNISLLLDIKIFILTFPTLFSSNGVN